MIEIWLHFGIPVKAEVPKTQEVSENRPVPYVLAGAHFNLLSAALEEEEWDVGDVSFRRCCQNSTGLITGIFNLSRYLWRAEELVGILTKKVFIETFSCGNSLSPPPLDWSRQSLRARWRSLTWSSCRSRQWQASRWSWASWMISLNPLPGTRKEKEKWKMPVQIFVKWIFYLCVPLNPLPVLVGVGWGVSGVVHHPVEFFFYMDEPRKFYQVPGNLVLGPWFSLYFPTGWQQRSCPLSKWLASHLCAQKWGWKEEGRCVNFHPQLQILPVHPLCLCIFIQGDTDDLFYNWHGVTYR